MRRGLFTFMYNGMNIQALFIVPHYLTYGDNVRENAFLPLLGREVTSLFQCDLFDLLQMFRKLEVIVQDEEWQSLFESAPFYPQPTAMYLFSHGVLDTNLSQVSDSLCFVF